MSTTTQKSEQAGAKKSPPVHKERLGSVEASVWLNNGTEGRVFYKVTLQKSYRGADGNFGNTDNLDPDDIFNAIKVLDRAHTWIAEERQRRFKEAKETAA